MRINRAYKTKLKLNNKERGMMNRCAGVARFVYSWALADRVERYKAGNPTSIYEQKKRFNALKDEQFPWIREVPYSLMEAAFWNLDTAYKNFFRRVKQGAKDKGFPNFKSKRNATKSFTVRDVNIEHDRIHLPGAIGWLRLAEAGYLPAGHYRSESATISERAGEWYISIQLEVDIPDRAGHDGIIGVDLGIKALATCSDGKAFDNPRTLQQYEKQLARLNRELSRRHKGGENWKKTKAKLNKLHAKIASVREHTQHDISRHVTANRLPEVVVLEDLNVAGMVQNRHLAKAVSDSSMGELSRQIEYKAGWHGVEIMRAGRWFPSSKTCSRCGVIKEELTLSDRTFVCDSCGLEIDRDLNAAINLAALGRTREQRGIACGVEVL